MTKKKKITLIVIIVILLVAFGGAYYVYNILNSVVSAPIDEDKLGINTNLDNTIVNIAFFGIDGRDDADVEGDRTDVIMIGTLNTKTNALKLTSVMRDTYSKICIDSESEITSKYAGDKDGIEWEVTETQNETDQVEENTETPENSTQELTENTQITEENKENPAERVTIDYENQRDVAQYDKINAAFYEAGVEGSILTLNTNFDLNIQDYVTVDFNCLMNAIDALGGVELNIPNEDVLYWTNQYLMESNYFGKRNDPDLTTTGVQTLTGAQALAFARNRYTDSDYGRATRQREVVQAVFNKVKNMDLVQAVNLLNNVYPYVQTSLSVGEISNYLTKVLSTKNITFQDYRIPTNKYGTSGFIDSIWYLFPDTLIDNNRSLHQFIYENDNYVPSNTVKQISQVIEDALTNEAYDTTYQVGSKEDPNADASETLVEGLNNTEEEVVEDDSATTENSE